MHICTHMHFAFIHLFTFFFKKKNNTDHLHNQLTNVHPQVSLQQWQCIIVQFTRHLCGQHVLSLLIFLFNLNKPTLLSLSLNLTFIRSCPLPYQPHHFVKTFFLKKNHAIITWKRLSLINHPLSSQLSKNNPMCLFNPFLSNNKKKQMVRNR